MQPRLVEKWVYRLSYSLLLLFFQPHILKAQLPSIGTGQTAISESADRLGFTPGRVLGEQWVIRAEQRLLKAADMHLPRRPRVSRTFQPLRQITFLGGDRICAEVIGLENEQIEIRLRGGQRITIPRDAISSVCVPPGEVELLTEDFENENLSPTWTSPIEEFKLDENHSAGGQRSLRMNQQSPPFVVRLPEQIDARVQFWIKVGDAADNIASSARIDFDFGENVAPALRIDVSPTRFSISTDDRSSRNNIPVTPGWHCLTAIFRNERTTCLVDESLLFSSSNSPGKLCFFRLSANSQTWIDSLVVSQFNAGPATIVRPVASTDDVVFQADHLQKFGRVKQIDHAGACLSMTGNERCIPWNKITGIGFRQPDRTVSGHFQVPEGMLAEIEFQPFADRPELAVDRLNVSIREVHLDFLVVTHPWLGTVATGWQDILKVRPRYFGQSIVLDARRIHLGDSIQTEFARPVPDGLEWSGEFVVPEGAAGDKREYWLVVTVAELEPAGRETPPGSPFLRELRDGQLLTELVLNEQAAGDLNRRIRFRSKSDRPEELRIPLSAGLLRTGQNSFQFKQTPLRKTGHFDNCELSNLRLEIAAPGMSH